MTARNCAICLEEGGTIECQKCQCLVHSKCAQDHLINTVLDPHCPGCLKEWPIDFLSIYLPKGWRLGALKNHREEILLDREKSLIPETQEAAARIILARKLGESLKSINSRIQETKQELTSIRINLQSLKRELSKAAYDKHPEVTRNRQVKSTLINLGTIRTAIIQRNYDPDTEQIIDRRPVAEEVEVITRREFIRPCPAPDCRGFLSTGWKCKICSAKVCSGCGELESVGGEETHECDPEIKASFEMIRHETKNCPKCEVPITKISGCDHMFCTNCNTAFSWRTMEIHTRGNSNPHYHEWMQARTAAAPRVQPREGEECGTLTYRIYYLRRTYNMFPEESVPDWVLILLRSILHIDGYVIQRERQIIDNHELQDLRIKYILKDIDEATWKYKIQYIDKKKKKSKFIADILELFVQGSVDILSQNDLRTHLPQIIIELNSLLTICNKELSKIDSIFGSTVYHITRSFQFINVIYRRGPIDTDLPFPGESPPLPTTVQVPEFGFLAEIPEVPIIEE